LWIAAETVKELFGSLPKGTALAVPFTFAAVRIYIAIQGGSGSSCLRFDAALGLMVSLRSTFASVRFAASSPVHPLPFFGAVRKRPAMWLTNLRPLLSRTRAKEKAQIVKQGRCNSLNFYCSTTEAETPICWRDNS